MPASVRHQALVGDPARMKRSGIAAARWNATARSGRRPARVFSAQLDVADELELIPAYAIALSGCNMRCSFCITGRESWDSSRGSLCDVPTLARDALGALQTGAARTVLVLGGEPTLFVPWLLEFAAHFPDNAPLVLKTNGICRREQRELLRGVFDLWLIDLKFGNDACASAIARTSDYLARVHETLLWAVTTSDIIVRHLLLPGHGECCWKPIAAWLAEHLPQAKVSLRFGYWPAWQARRTLEMNRPIIPAEQQRALDLARHFNLNLIR